MTQHGASSHSGCEPLIGVYRIARNRGSHPGTAELLFLNGNTALTNVEFDAGGLLPLLVELIARERCGDGQRGDDDVEKAAIHFLESVVALF